MKQGTKCVKPPKPLVTTHLDCPTPLSQPPEILKTCTPPYGEYGGKAAFERIKKLYPSYNFPQNCSYRDNPAYLPWVDKNWKVQEQMGQGHTCGPNGTAVATTGGWPFTSTQYGEQITRNYQRPWNACPPPAPAKLLPRKCEWTTAPLPRGPQRDAVEKKYKAIEAKIAAVTKEIQDYGAKAPVEPTQYMCRAKYKNVFQAGSDVTGATNDLIIGNVRDKKCVVATNTQMYFGFNEQDFSKAKVIEAEDYRIAHEHRGRVVGKKLGQRGPTIHPLGI